MVVLKQRDQVAGDRFDQSQIRGGPLFWCESENQSQDRFGMFSLGSTIMGWFTSRVEDNIYKFAKKGFTRLRLASFSVTPTTLLGLKASLVARNCPSKIKGSEPFSDVLCDAGKPCGLKSVCLYGGTSKGPQIASLKSGVDIVIGTPGRLKDLIEMGVCCLKDVSFVRRKNPDKEIMRMDVWLETHTKNDGSASCEEMVSRMLLGGMNVVGLYIWAAESSYKTSSTLLWQVANDGPEKGLLAELDEGDGVNTSYICGLHPSRAASGVGIVPGFMNQVYPNSRLYGQNGNTVRMKPRENLVAALYFCSSPRMLKRTYLCKRSSSLQRMLQVNWRAFSTITIGLS